MLSSSLRQGTTTLSENRCTGLPLPRSRNLAVVAAIAVYHSSRSYRPMSNQRCWITAEPTGRGMYILGLSQHHDSAAALLHDGQVVAFSEEERFTRIKHDGAFPALAASWCLETAGITLADVD